MEVEGRFLGLMAVSNKAAKESDEEVAGAAGAGRGGVLQCSLDTAAREQTPARSQEVELER